MFHLLPLMASNLWRSKRRSILTILGIAVAILVFGALHVATDTMTMGARQAGADETLSVRRDGRSNVLASRLPESYEDRVAGIAGVAAATGILAELAIVGEKNVHVFLRGIDPGAYRRVQPLQVDGTQWASFAENRGAAIVGHRLLEKLDWNVGDEVELAEAGLKLRIAGVIPPQGLDLESHVLLHRGHLQALRNREGQVTFVKVATGESSPEELAARIDDRLATAPVPTRTTTSARFSEAVVDEFMGFTAYLRLMALITVLVTTLGAANAVAMSVRERTRDFGVLKTVGYRPVEILALVVGESLVLAAAGGVLGLALTGWVVHSRAAQLAGFTWTPATIGLAAIMALVIGLGGGLLPALRAARLRPVEALRVID
ncbi:MAG: FtsX-like permease family protein [Planctomycetota bacterium]